MIYFGPLFQNKHCLLVAVLFIMVSGEAFGANIPWKTVASMSEWIAWVKRTRDVQYAREAKRLISALTASPKTKISPALDEQITTLIYRLPSASKVAPPRELPLKPSQQLMKDFVLQLGGDARKHYHSSELSVIFSDQRYHMMRRFSEVRTDFPRGMKPKWSVAINGTAYSIENSTDGVKIAIRQVSSSEKMKKKLTEFFGDSNYQSATTPKQKVLLRRLERNGIDTGGARPIEKAEYLEAKRILNAP